MRQGARVRCVVYTVGDCGDAPETYPSPRADGPEAGIEQLCEIFGFQRAGQGRVSYGDLTVAVVSVADVPQDLLPIQMDHLALKVPDLDQAMARIQAPWSL